MSTVSTPRQALARLAGLHAHGRTPDPKIEAEARRALAEAKIAKAIQESVAAAPPLSQDQCDRLSRLLTGGAR